MARPVVILGCGDSALMGLLLSLTLPCLGNTKVTLTTLLQTRSPLGRQLVKGAWGGHWNSLPQIWRVVSLSTMGGGGVCGWLMGHSTQYD